MAYSKSEKRAQRMMANMTIHAFTGILKPKHKIDKQTKQWEQT